MNALICNSRKFLIFLYIDGFDNVRLLKFEIKLENELCFREKVHVITRLAQTTSTIFNVPQCALLLSLVSK